MVKESYSLDMLAKVSSENRQEWILKPKVLNLRRIIFVILQLYCHIGNLGFSCVYFGDHITTAYIMYYATYCIFFSLFFARAR